jgi:hypothetical protein
MIIDTNGHRRVGVGDAAGVAIVVAPGGDGGAADLVSTPLPSAMAAIHYFGVITSDITNDNTNEGIIQQ